MSLNIDEILSKIPSLSTESRIEHLQTLIKLSQNTPELLRENIRKILRIIQITLNDPIVEIPLLSTNLVIALLSLFPEEIEGFFNEQLGLIVMNIGHSQPVLRKASHNCLLTFIRKTTNFDLILRIFLEKGFENKDCQISQKTINSFQSLYLSEGKHIKWDSQNMRKSLETLIEKTQDSNTIIAKASEQALLSLNSNEKLKNILRTFTKAKQEVFINFIDNYKGKTLINTTPIKEIPVITANNTPKAYNFMNIANNLLETPEKLTNICNSSLNSKENGENSKEMRNFLKSPINQQRIYGIFPIKVINELLEEKDWQIRSNAIEELEKLMEEIDQKSEFLPHLSDFLSLITRLLQDNNFKICLTTVNILSKLLIFREIRDKKNIGILSIKLLEKLSDSKIAIRQACIRIIKELFEGKNGGIWLENLFIGFESANVHIREESLNLLIFFLGKTTFDEIYYEKLLIIVMKFLEDVKLKVKNAAFETVFSIEKHMKREKFESILKKNLTIEGFELVLSRIPGKLAINSDVMNSGDLKVKNNGEFVIKSEENLPRNPIKMEKNDGFLTRKSENLSVNSSEIPRKKPTLYSNNAEISTSCSSRSNQTSSFVFPLKKEEEKRALSAFSMKTSTVSEELEKINENRSDSSEKSPKELFLQEKDDIQKKKKAILPKNLKKTTIIKKNPSFSLKERENPDKMEFLLIKSKEYQNKNDYYENLEEISERKEKNIKENTIKSSNLDYKQAFYLEKVDLQPLKSPESSFKSLLSDLNTEDWSKQFESLNTLRRLIFFHPETLLSSSLSPIILELFRLIESLRSSLSKNAMLATTELVEKLKQKLDPHADILLSRLLKKGLDSNAFIYEEVKKLLIIVCINLSDTKIVPFLLSNTQSKSSQAKLNVLICFEALVKKFSSKFLQMRDNEKFVMILVGFCFDNSNEVRTIAKAIFLNLFSLLLDRNEMEKILIRVLNDQNYQKIMIIIEKEFKNKDNYIVKKTAFRLKKSATPDENTRNSQENNNICFNSTRIQHNLGKNTTKNPFDIEDFNRLLSQSINSDWKNRLESVKELGYLAKNNAEELIKGKFGYVFLDVFLKLMIDSNAKVALQTISSFRDIIDEIKGLIQQNLMNVLNAIFQVLGSFNAGIRKGGEELLDIFVKKFEKSAFIQGFCNGVLFAVSKAKGLILVKLMEIMDEVFEKKPSVITKHVFPLIIKLIDENKADLKPGLQKMIQKLHDLMGNELIGAFPQSKTQVLMEYLKK